MLSWSSSTEADVSLNELDSDSDLVNASRLNFADSAALRLLGLLKCEYPDGPPSATLLSGFQDAWQ